MAHDYIIRILRIDTGTRPALYRQIYQSAEIVSANYILDLVFAAGIATLGLVLNSPAVVIGAMLISPLMGPILAAGLAFASSDIYLGVKSILGLLGSMVAAVAFSAVLVWLLPFQSPTSEILARTQPNLLDLGVAIFSGLAGSVVTARSLSGSAASALPGVAIAVALMPPLCTVGFGVGSGWNWPIISGAALLFLTNLVAIAASAFFVFYIIGMDATAMRAAIPEDVMRRAAGNRIYTLVHDSALGRLLGDVGRLRWRIAMVAVTLAVLFVPLRSSFLQLRDETLGRAAAREVLGSLTPKDHILSEQLELLTDRVIARMVTTTAVDKTRIAAAEAELSRRTGKHASIQIRQVANEEELISLRERLRAPQSPPPVPPAPPQTLGSLQPRIWALVDAPLRSVWPGDSAELAKAEAGFSKDKVTIRIAYHSSRRLSVEAQEAIRNSLRASLALDTLDTTFDWLGPARNTKHSTAGK